MLRNFRRMTFNRLAGPVLAASLAALSGAASAGVLAQAPGTTTKGRAILYVTNSAGDDVTLVDVATHKVIGSIRTGPTPHGIEASPDGTRLYISGETDDDIIAIDTTTSTILWRAAIGDRPNYIAISGDGRYVYAPIRSSDYADVVDTVAQKKIKSIHVGHSPHNAYRAPVQNWVYVTSMEEDKITIIDVATQSAIGEIPVGGETRPAAITNDNTRLYVALTGLHGFVVVDIAQRRVVDKLELPPSDVEAVSTYGYTPTHGLDLRPDNRQFWITSVFGNAVRAFSVPGHKLLGVIPVGEVPNWMTFGLDGKTLYVSNSGSNDVSVIDTEKIREIARIPVGLAPKRLLVVRIPKGMNGPEDVAWARAAKRPSAADYYLRGGGVISCETYSFRDRFSKGDLNIEEAPALFRRLGIPGISINARYIGSWSPDSLDRIKKAIHDNQRVLTALILDGNLISDDAAANQKQIAEDKRLLRAAHHLGAPVVRIDVGQTGRGDPADHTEGVERAVAAVRQLVPAAKNSSDN